MQNVLCHAFPVHFKVLPTGGLMQINDNRFVTRIDWIELLRCRSFKGLPAMLRIAVRQIAATLLLMAPALALSPAEQRGKVFALTNCARCHSVDRVTQSPLKIAPPFRTLHLRYPVETLGEALAEGIQTGHPTMPEFQLDPDQIHDLLSYMKTLE